MNYRVQINDRGNYYIQKEVDKKFLWFKEYRKSKEWKAMTYTTGGAGYIWNERYLFEKEEDAIKKIVELVKEDKANETKEDKIAKKIEKFKAIELNTEDIKEKFPEHFL